MLQPISPCYVKPVLLVLVLLNVCASGLAQVSTVRNELKHDVSPPLSDLAQNPPVQNFGLAEADQLKAIPLPAGFKPENQPDTVLQSPAQAPPQPLAPTLGLNFEGLGSGFPNFVIAGAPPDTNGAVGKTQYVQWVNLSFAVFDKATGNILPNFPVPGNTLWQGFGGGCENDNDGDPIVLYDKLADRWVFSQFDIHVSPFLQCVAVSTSPDATGTYNRYAFSYTDFDDYPKMGVWPDAYYETFNMFAGATFVGAEACAYDRNAMLNGQSATQICFQQVSTVSSLLPADVDGHPAPPVGSPNYVVDFGVNSLNLYKFHVDFVTPANSTFTGPINIPVAPFTPFCPQIRGCVPQPPGDGTKLDSLGDRLMYRLAYRNFGDHESLVVNHSVVANSTTLNSGVRWYEIQNPNGAAPTVSQQSTWAPDSNYRWMGSAAMDVSGDLAVGYSVASSTTFPSVAFAARLASDPSSTLQPEISVVAGGGSQTSALTRWGDYSAMQVDPVDGCTFWYAQEYLQSSGEFNWNTRINNFIFPSCGVPDLAITKTHSGNFTQGQTGTYTITVTNVGHKGTDGTIVTVTDTLPAKLTATAMAGTNWMCTLGTLTCTRTDVLAPGNGYEPITLTVSVAADAPAALTNSASVSGGGDKNPDNNSVTDPTTVIMTGPDPAITKVHSGPFIQGQTGTYTITVTNAGLSPTSGVVTITDTLPTGLTLNTASGSGWTCGTGIPVICTRSDALPSNTSYPAITLTVNVAKTSPASVINTATVSGGGDTNPLNNNASDPTSVIPPPPDLVIAKTHAGNFTQGQSFAAYTIVVSNIGAGPTTGASVLVHDSLPAGLRAASAGGIGWGCTFLANFAGVDCFRSDVLAAGSSYPAITFSVNVAGNAPASVTNTVSVSGGGEVNTSNDTASDPTTINAAPDLTMAMSHNPDPFVVGQTGTYTLTVTNIGGAATTGAVNVSDFLPLGLVATATSGTGWSCNTLPSTSVNCTRSDSLASASSYAALVVTVSVNGASGPSVTNVASVSGGGELSNANGTASNVTNITAPALTITKTHAPDPFSVGQSGTYTITVGNTGKIGTVGVVTVTDFLPFGLTATAVSGSGWSCNALPTTSLTCTRSDSLATGTTYPALVVTVSVNGATPTITNFASVTGGGDLQVHSASDTANVNTPTLAVTKSHTGTFTVGQNENYTISVSNVGKVATQGVVSLTDFLPFGMSAIATGGTGWSCSNLPTTFLTCTRADSLVVNATYPVLTLVVNVTGGGPSTTNQVSVTGGGDGLTHSASDPTIVNAPSLNITKSHTGDPFVVGQTGTYTISVDNKAGKLATSGLVTVGDSLPSGLTATAITATGWSCSSVPSTFVNCSRSDALAPGAAYPPILLTVSVNGGTPSVENFVTLNGGGDPNFHSAFDLTNINGPSLGITKSHTSDPFIVGQTGTYNITVDNKAGKTPTSGTVTVGDSLPFGMTATGVTAPGWSCNAPPTTSLTCTRSDALAAGGTYPTISVTVSVSGGGPSVFNFANVNGGGDSFFHSASDLTNINGPTLGITKSHTPDPFIVGQTGTYTITVDNKAGKTPTIGTVTVQDFLPSGLLATAVTGAGWSCSALPAASLTCTRSDSLASGGTYPSLVVTVNVTGGGPSVTNFASVSGGGDNTSHSASDLARITGPILGIAESHTPDPFAAGHQGTYTITVSNTGTIATNGAVNLNDSLPSGLTLATASGTGWGCSGTTFVNCTRSDSLQPNTSYPPLVLTVNVGNVANSVTNSASVTGGGDSQFHSVNDTATVTNPTLSITKSHTGNFTAGQTGSYTITVGNVSSTPTVGTVTLTDFLPFNMTAIEITGSGWGCSNLPTSFLTCTRADSLAANASYPPLIVTVSVGAGQSSVTNQASATGGGDGLIHSASDPTIVNTPTLSITKSHTGNFSVGQPGTYTITVSNPGTVDASGNVNVSDSLPSGLTAASTSGAGWNCFPQTTFVNCSRSDTLSAGTSYPPLSVGVAVAGNAAATLVNQATVSGGGDNSNHTVSDTTNINLPDLAITASHVSDFSAGQPGSYTITITNVGTVATGGGSLIVDDVMPVGLQATAANGTGWNCSILPGPQTEMNCTQPAGVLAPGNSYPPITLTVAVDPAAPSSVINTVSVFGIGETNFANNIASDTTRITGLRFVPVTPCRIADTRNPDGPFGGPFISAQTSRGFIVPNSNCNIPATAQAYSVNVTVVPHGSLGFLTLYPCGHSVPLSSTLNSDDGRIKAVAAVIPVGTNGGLCVFVTNDTDVILDIDGYFTSATNPAALAFYPITPCRLVDTRQAAGPLGGPSLAAQTARTFPVLSSSCNLPVTAQAYSMNFTSVPNGPLNFLSTWAAGQNQPLVSTLNALTGTITANAAVVPAGTNGDISVFVTNSSDLIIDVNGYFAPATAPGLGLFPLVPCRVLDTRNPTPTGGLPFSGELDVNVQASNCNAGSSAQAYVLNATVVPPGPMRFITLWPQGSAQPLVSTLNAYDGAITSNMAIVPTTNGSVGSFASDPTHLIIDLSGFFAP